MSRRRRPQFDGRPPEMPRVLAAVPELNHPVYQAQSLALIHKLVAILHQIDPPSPPSPTTPGRGPYQFKFNVKLFPNYFLLKSPNGAGRPVLLDDLRVLVSATDWDTYAKRLKEWLDGEAHAVMEQQSRDRTYDWIQKMSRGGGAKAN